MSAEVPCSEARSEEERERLIIDHVPLLKHIVGGRSAVIVHEEFQKETLVRHFGNGHEIHVIEHGIRIVLNLCVREHKR